MELKTGETVKVNTKTYGEVKVWNVNDKTLHFYWGQGKKEKHGYIDIETGYVFNVPQNLINEMEL